MSRGVVRVAARGEAAVQVAAGQRWSRRGEEVVASSGSQPNTSPEGDRGLPGAEERRAAGAAAIPAHRASTDSPSAVAAAEDDPAALLDGAPGRRDDDADGRLDDDADGRRDDVRPGQPATGGRVGGAGARTGRPAASAEDAPSSAAAAPDDLPPLSCDDVDLCRRAALGSVGPAAGEALYSLIYIELFREKDPGQAITLAELYERRFARRRAREAEAVLWLRVIAHGAAGEPTGRRDAARRYLERHPRGRFSADAARLLGE